MKIELNKSMLAMEIPERVRSLPVSPAGYPVPWFVQWFNDGQPCDEGQGVPDFRVIDSRKMVAAVRKHQCWVCGGAMFRNKAFVIGPMCAINRVISEPPSHRDCAIFSATACPFLSKPKMRRNEKDMPEQGKQPAGIAIDRNPGVACVWVTRSFELIRPHQGNPGVLFSLGNPIEVLWFCQGRAASRDEVELSINSGLPLLMDMAVKEGADAIEALEQQRQLAIPLIPAR